MAIIKSTRDWEGVTVEERINTETGQIEIYSLPTQGAMGSSTPGSKLAETYQDGDKNKWRINSKDSYRTLVNNSRKNAGQAGLTEKAFTKKFYEDGAPLFNSDRATTLNNNDNYSTQQEARTARESFYESNVPLIVSPKTGNQVNSLGVKTTEDINGEQDDGGGNDNGGGGGGAATQEELNEAVEKGRYDRGGKNETLRYPVENTGPFQFDYVAIKAYDYKASQLGFDYKVDKNIQGQGYERVILPMQPQISETNGVNWSDDQLNPIQAMLGKFAASSINAAGSLIDFSKFTQDMGSAFSDLKTDVEEALRDPNTAKFITAYFAGQAVGANVIGRQTGMVINPNLELLFNGPNLRTFNYNFKLTPRSAKESEMCKKIIRAFKRNMAVSRSPSNLFLQSPRIFKIEYFFKEDIPHPYLNKIKPCALTNFNVNYTPDGSYSTFDETGSMTQFEINMAFTEVMPIYAEDLDENDDATMGY